MGVFGWEEYMNNKKEKKVATKLLHFRSLDKLSEIEIPDVKLLNGEYVSIDDYEEFYKNKKEEAQLNIANTTVLTDDMLPF